MFVDPDLHPASFNALRTVLLKNYGKDICRCEPGLAADRILIAGVDYSIHNGGTRPVGHEPIAVTGDLPKGPDPTLISGSDKSNTA